MSERTRYVMLMASLPHAHGLLDATETPISRPRLEQRLTLLDADDAALLRDIERVLRWDRIPMERTDREVIEGATAVLERLESPTLRRIVESWLEARTILAALRRRARGDAPPPAGEPFGFGAVAETIRREWTQPAFQLGGSRPWVPEAAALIEHGEARQLERLVLELTWRELDRLGQGHWFDFEAVVLYVLRWNLIHRRLAANEQAALARFGRMTEEGLGRFAGVFTAPPEGSAGGGAR